MADQPQTHDEKALARRLKQEAAGTWPEFSESLHDRIVEAVAEEQARLKTVSAAPTSNRRRRLAFAAALTAACLILVVVMSWWPGFTGVPGDGVAGDPPEVPSNYPPSPEEPRIPDPSVLAKAHLEVMIGVAEPLDWLVAPTVEENRWAHLDHDVRVAIELVTAQLTLDIFEREENNL